MNQQSQGARGWAAAWQLAGYGQALGGRGATASQGGASGLHRVRASPPSLTHASRAVLVGLEAPAAALVAAAPVPAVGVDADGFVPGTDEGELGALVHVCGQRGLGGMHGLGAWGCWPWPLQFPPHMPNDLPPEVAMRKPCLCSGGSWHGHCHIPVAPPSLVALAQRLSHACHASHPQQSTLPPPRDTMGPLRSRATAPSPTPCAGQAVVPCTERGSSPACTPSLLPGCCPQLRPGGRATASKVQALTYTASVLVLGESLPALHLGRSRDRRDGEESALGSHRASRAQPLIPAPQSLLPCAPTCPSPPAGQA